MNVTFYTGKDISNFKQNYKLNTEKYNLILSESFKNILSLCETYEINNKKLLSKNNKKFKFNKKNNNNIRTIPKERPKNFLNKSKGEGDDLNKELNSNLNKLSPSNYDKIYKKVIDLFVTKNNIFDYEYFINNLFNKAVMQPIFCPLYVKILILIKGKSLEMYEEEKISHHLKLSCDKFKSMIIDFKEQDDDVLNPNNYDDFCEKNKKKIFKKGFSQFIGELYKNKFLDNVYINEFIYLLYQNIKTNLDNNNINIENSVVCFMELINTTTASLSDNKLLDNIKEIMNYKILPKKIKFKLMDLL